MELLNYIRNHNYSCWTYPSINPAWRKIYSNCEGGNINESIYSYIIFKTKLDIKALKYLSPIT